MKTLTKAILSFIAFFIAHSMTSSTGITIVPSLIFSVIFDGGFARLMEMDGKYKSMFIVWLLLVLTGFVFAIIAAVESFRSEESK